MNQVKNFLNRADFSKATDLKQRLRAQLFPESNIVPLRQELSDEELSLVAAAGDLSAFQKDDSKPNKY